MDIPDGWTLADDDQLLIRRFTFGSFGETIAFCTRVAMHAEKVDHHPEIRITYGSAEFRLSSHDTGGVTERDVRLAEAIGRMAE